ncbi:MAG: TonB family protein [Spirochaetales bacterium]|nr:TonB family protein [Spirochaetales bacterium]
MQKNNKKRSYSITQNEPLWSIRSIILAFLFTLSMYILLPFSEMIHTGQKKGPDITIRQVDTTTLTQQPPPPPEQPSPPETKSTDSEAPKPQLQTSQQLHPLQVALSMNLGDIGGDFSLDLFIEPDITESASQTSVEEMIFEVSQVDQPPEPLLTVPPIYPMNASMAGIEGKVELEFLVQTDGTVSDITIKNASPPGVFEKAALRALNQWRFKPGTKNGQPVITRVYLPMRFQLEDS